MLLWQAINNFCKELGITRSDADIHLHKLEHHVRAELEVSSPRTLAVLKPLLVVLTNLPSDYHEIVKAKVRSSSHSTSPYPASPSHSGDCPLDTSVSLLQKHT